MSAMASSTASFAVHRASQEDLPAVVEVLFHGFDQFARENYFGVTDTNDLGKLADKYAKIMSSDPADIWIKVEDVATGKVVAVSNWKLYLAPESACLRVRDEPAPWLSGDAVEKQKLLLEPMNVAREKSNPGPFMCKSHPSSSRPQALTRRRPAHSHNASRL